MGWYFLSQYEDFYRPGDPYGIVKWTHPGAYSEQLSGEFGIFEDALIRVSDLVEILDLPRRGKLSIENELLDGLNDSEIPANTSSRVWAATPKVALAARSIKRHADTVTEFNAKLLDAIRRKEIDKAAFIRRVLRRSVVIEYSGVEDHEREGDKMTEMFLGATRAERQKAIEGWSEERLRACDELVEELCRCRRGFYVYNSVKANYQKAAGVIRRLISEGPRPPPHLDSADQGMDDAPDERGIEEMGSEWDYDSFMVLTEDEEDMAEAEDASEDSDAEAARAGLARGASRLRQMHSAPRRREEDHNNNLSGAGSSSGSSGGDSGNASLSRSSNPRFDGNDSIGDDYDADCEDGEDNGDEDGADGDGVGEDDVWE